jgi:molecular chaperone DnaK
VADALLARIRAMCVRAKEELSTEPDVRLSVPLPSGPREVTVTRLEFNDMIRPSIRQTSEALRRTISSAGLRPGDLTAVLLAGGSSRIPLVSQLLSAEFGKPVRMTLHPKFTVALGAAAVAARPTSVTSAQSPPVPAPRRKWLVPAVAAAAAVTIGVATTLLLVPGDDQTRQTAAPVSTTSTTTTPETSSTAPETSGTTVVPPGTVAGTVDGAAGAAGPRDGTDSTPPPLRLLDSGIVKPWVGVISSDENWDGTRIGANGARQGPISATWDGGLHVTWGDAPGELYLLTGDDPQNLQSYVDAGGALVFTVTVHEPPADNTTMSVFCDYPCGGDVVVTNLFRNLQPEQPTTVRIPLSCFTAGGLDATRVDTPFVVHTEKPFDATFADIRWEATAATTTSCANLR